ncbi:MAG: hypothetical protein GF311_23305 [Candidatus Lokiarchaeota archaeon]|nr:hypothetical protein [Candidatus Lokiarchaeota archaeon]
MEIKSKSEIIKYIDENQIPGINDKIRKIINIIELIKEFIINIESDLTWSNYKSEKEILIELDTMIQEFEEENFSRLLDLQAHFAPASEFQEISISSGWSEEFIVISKMFEDALITLIKEFDLKTYD